MYNSLTQLLQLIERHSWCFLW